MNIPIVHASSPEAIRKKPVHFLWYLVCLLIVGSAGYLRFLFERLIGPTPVGTDASNTYLTYYLTYKSSLLVSLTHFDFLYYIFSWFHRSNIDAMVAMKSFGIGLFMGLTLLFTLFMRVAFKRTGPSLAATAIIFAFQMSTLRLSWDLFRNEFGLCIALIAIICWLWYRETRNVAYLVISIAFGLLTYGTHQMVAFLLLVLCGVALVVWLVGKAKFNETVVAYGLPFLMVVLWLFMAPYIHAQGFQLVIVDPHPAFRVSIDIFRLLFLPFLAPVALLGMLTKKQPILLGITSIILLQIFGHFLFHNAAFFLWDRWLYFLGLPFTAYIMLGIDWLYEETPLRKLLKRQYLKIPLYAITAVVLVLPSYPFLNPRVTVYQRQDLDKAVFNFVPGSLMANGFISNYFERDLSLTFAECTQELRNIHDGSSTIALHWTQAGIMQYYTPDLVPFIALQPDPPTLQGKYYAFGYTWHENKTLIKPNRTTSLCPIFLHAGP